MRSENYDFDDEELLNAMNAQVVLFMAKKQQEAALPVEPVVNGEHKLPSLEWLVEGSDTRKPPRGEVDGLRGELSKYIKEKRGLTFPGFDDPGNAPAWYPRDSNGKTLWRPLWTANLVCLLELSHWLCRQRCEKSNGSSSSWSVLLQLLIVTCANALANLQTTSTTCQTGIQASLAMQLLET